MDNQSSSFVFFYFSVCCGLSLLYGLGVFTYVCVDRYWEGRGFGKSFLRVWGVVTGANLLVYGVLRGPILELFGPNNTEPSRAIGVISLMLFLGVVVVNIFVGQAKMVREKALSEPILASCTFLGILGWAMADFGVTSVTVGVLASPFALLFAVLIGSFFLGPFVVSAISWARYRNGEHLGSAGWFGLLWYLVLPFVGYVFGKFDSKIVLILGGVALLTAPWLVLQYVTQSREQGVHAKERWWLSVVTLCVYCLMICGWFRA